MKLALECCGVVATAALLLSGCGWLVAPALPWRLRPFRILLAPFLGFALVTGIARTLNVLGLQVPAIAWLLVALAALGWTVSLVRHRRPAIERSLLAVLLVCCVAFVVAAWPLWVSGRLTTLGATSDAVRAADLTHHLELHPLSLADPHGDYGHTGELYLVAVLDVLTGHRSFELLTLVMSLLFALTPAAVYVWVHCALRLSRTASLLAAALAAVHNLLLFAVLDNFLAQVAALSCFPILLAFGIEGCRRPRWRTATVFGLLVGLVSSLYPVFAAYGVLSVAVFWAALRIQRGGASGIARDAVWWLGAAGVALLSNGVSAIRALGYLRYVGTLTQTGGLQRVGLGDLLVYPSVYEVVGLTSHLAAELQIRPWPLPRGTVSLIALGAGIAMAYGAWKLRRSARLALLLPLLTVVALTLFQRYGLNRPFGYPYGYFKSVSLVAVEAIGLLGAGLAAGFRIQPARWLAAVLAAAILGLNLLNCAWTSRYALAHTALSATLLEALEHAELVVGSHRLFVDLGDSLPEAWVGSLWPNPDALVLRSAGVQSGQARFCEWALVNNDLQRLEDEPWYSDAMSRAVWANRRFAVRRRTDAITARLTLPDTILRPGDTLVLNIVRRILSAEARGSRSTGEMATPHPSALQLTVIPLDSEPAQLTIRGESPFSLPPQPSTLTIRLGGPSRLLPIHLENRGPSRLAVAALHAVAAPLGTEGPPLNVTASTHGYATLHQDLDLPMVRYSFVIWPPSEPAPRYRFAIHAVEELAHRQLGAWSITLPGDHPHKGRLVINLASGRAQAELDGRSVKVEGGVEFPAGTAAARFLLAGVLWQLQPRRPIANVPLLAFDRLHGPADHLTILQPGWTTLVRPARPAP